MGLMKLSKGSDNLGNQKIRKVDKRSLGNKLSPNKPCLKYRLEKYFLNSTTAVSVSDF